jgi:uncharacterized Zn-binding protein involved in type VI secretion
MPGIARKQQDTAGGTIIGGSANVLVNGTGAARIGDAVAGHFPGGIHSSPSMAEGSSTVFVNSISVCRQGDKATCGHTATGSSNVFAG